MRFEWDENKRRRNVEKHGIDFVRAQAVFDGRPVYSAPSPRGGEERFITVGELDGRFIAVAWTARGADTVRIISARKARDGEERKHRELYG